MKYTNYLWNTNLVDIESIQVKRGLMKYPLRLVSIPVAIIGIATIGGAMPIAMMVDGYRNIKCIAIHYKRKPHKNIIQFVTFPDILRIIDKPIQTVKVYGNSITKRR